jgi:hypothetical protein
MSARSRSGLGRSGLSYEVFDPRGLTNSQRQQREVQAGVAMHRAHARAASAFLQIMLHFGACAFSKAFENAQGGGQF